MSELPETYESPLVARYAGRAMVALFTPTARARAWREVWIALAEAEHELGAPVTEAQVEALRASRDAIDLERVAAIEATTRHDVMAHIHAWAEVCPEGAPVLHLGATSAFVTDNADALIQRRALVLIRDRCVQLVRAMAALAEREADQPTLGYTHFQVAQPVTAGKRVGLWLQDVVWDLEQVEAFLERLPCRGAKGTTGTQASYLELFGGDDDKVAALDRAIATKLGFPASVALSGQTYPRKLDAQLGDVLAGIATTLARVGRDVRLLCHTGEMREGFAKGQVGSSAMPYKRNPMKAERICALARVAIQQRNILTETAAAQWLERSLDDSAARRLAIPDLFLVSDGLLRAAHELISGLQVDLKTVNARLSSEAPFLAVEKLLVRGVAAGGDRQRLHEWLKQHAIAARTAEPGQDPGALFKAALAAESEAELGFKIDAAEVDAMTAPSALVGRAPTQIRSYLTETVNPLLARYPDVGETSDPLRV